MGHVFQSINSFDLSNNRECLQSTIGQTMGATCTVPIGGSLARRVAPAVPCVVCLLCATAVSTGTGMIGQF